MRKNRKEKIDNGGKSTNNLLVACPNCMILDSGATRVRKIGNLLRPNGEEVA